MFLQTTAVATAAGTLAPGCRGTTAGATTAAGPAALRVPAGLPVSPFALKLGLATYSLRKLSLDQVIEACKAQEVRYITIKDMHLPPTDTAEALQAACAKITAAGLTVTGGGVINMKNEAVSIRKTFEYARICKFPLIVASAPPEALNTLEAMVKEFGIPVAIHNHGPEDKHYQTPKVVLDHIAGRDARIGVCMDIGHTVRAGADPIASANLCGPRLFDLHVKDLRDKSDKASQVAVGRGGIDIAGLLRTLQTMRFAGNIALEYEINADNPMPGVAESLAFLRGVRAGIATT